MRFNGKLKKYGLFSSLGGGFLAVLIFIMAISNFSPLGILPEDILDVSDSSLITGTAATYKIANPVTSSFGTYIPKNLTYNPQISPTTIQPGLNNVDLQGITIPSQVQELLVKYGFALVQDDSVNDIYELYNYDEIPKFITADLCLHAYHVLYDISLRILETTYFASDFEEFLLALRTDQVIIYDDVTEIVVKDALAKNIAFLSVMLNLIDNSTYPPLPRFAELTNAELTNIENGIRAPSAIFGYDEDYTQYKIRGHYTRSGLLGRYFQAMMYAGRMSFLLQSPTGGIAMGINQTRMALLLISSFNTSINIENAWGYWDRLYEPTAFYVGACDDLTPREYYQIWQDLGGNTGDNLAEELFIQDFIEEGKAYRKPKINSMFIMETEDAGNVTQGFRLMGQRFIPDSYIFQELVHTKVNGRMFPMPLDIFSVFGSPRAAFLLQDENTSFSDYNSQIKKLRGEFGNLTEFDWVQNLYWLWLYTLFPLLDPVTEKTGYPGFMQSNAWTDKALMTTLGSWTELRHDTILYAKQSYTKELAMVAEKQGYVEPYPEVYSRLSSLVRMMDNGLRERGLIIDGFSHKLNSISSHFDYLSTISIKELENTPLNSSEIGYLLSVGEEIAGIASYSEWIDEEYVSQADDRMAIVADVHTDPNSGQVLEVGTGNPFTIYVVVQDANGNLRLTRGGTFSYYEFTYPMENRLTDEEWHSLLDNDSPSLPDWLTTSLPIYVQDTTAVLVVLNKES